MARRVKKSKPIERCSWHIENNLGFLSAHTDAEERIARGEQQRQCPLCLLWHWDDQWGNEPPGLNLPIIRPEEEELNGQSDGCGARASRKGTR